MEGKKKLLILLTRFLKEKPDKNKETRIYKNEESSSVIQLTIKRSNTHISGIPKRQGNEKATEILANKIIAEHFANPESDVGL